MADVIREGSVSAVYMAARECTLLRSADTDAVARIAECVGHRLRLRGGGPGDDRVLRHRKRPMSDSVNFGSGGAHPNEGEVAPEGTHQLASFSVYADESGERDCEEADSSGGSGIGRVDRPRRARAEVNYSEARKEPNVSDDEELSEHTGDEPDSDNESMASPHSGSDLEDESEDESDSEDEPPKRRNRKAPLQGTVTSDGKARRSGASLVMAAPSSEAAMLIPQMAARDNSLQKKGKYRDAKGIAGESTISALDLVAMPRREMYEDGPDGDAAHDTDYAVWQKKAMHARKMQRRCAAAYEKKVGMVNSWMRSIGHTPFAEWVQTNPEDDAEGYTLTLIMDGGVPRVPTVSAICEWALRYAMGELKKGGSREYRNMPW